MDEIRINQTLAITELAEKFKTDGRLRITEFLEPQSAEYLYQQIANHRDWSLYFTGNGRHYELPPASVQKLKTEEMPNTLAYEEAGQGGVAYLYDGFSLSKKGADPDGTTAPGIFSTFIHAQVFASFFAKIIDGNVPCQIDGNMKRMRSEHFSSYGDATSIQEGDEDRVAIFRYHLTPEWSAEWGGLTEFRHSQGGLVESYVPHFNCLDVFSFPQGNWTSIVAPFVTGATYFIGGSVLHSDTAQ